MAITAGYDQVRMIDPLARSQISLVLLPGMDGTGVLFAPLIAALGPDYRVVVVTYPTHEPLGYEALLPIARAALPADGPFILLGESFSGPIAITLAAERPAQGDWCCAAPSCATHALGWAGCGR